MHQSLAIWYGPKAQQLCNLIRSLQTGEEYIRKLAEEVEDIRRLLSDDFVSLIPSMSPSPKNKRKTTSTKKKQKPSSTVKTPSLPYDVLLSIVARVPRLYYPTLSLVSKSFRSLVASPELYKARSLLGHTESCLYVCFRSDSCSCWFTLAKKPDQTTAKKNSSAYVLARVPMPHDSLCEIFSSLVAVGSDIYNIGVSRETFTSRVSILDCRSHTWREAPSLPLELVSFSASVFDQKIYVAGSYYVEGDSWKSSLEVLDTKTQTWDLEPIPCSFLDIPIITCIDGKLHVLNKFNGEVIAFNSKEGRWDMVERMSDIQFVNPYCEIDNVLYFVSVDGALTWYDTKERRLRYLKGLVGLPKLPHGSCVRLTGYGGKMAVLWERDYGDYPITIWKIIWCAEIALERRNSCEIWGKVEWCDTVLVVPRACKLIKAHATTL